MKNIEHGYAVLRFPVIFLLVIVLSGIFSACGDADGNKKLNIIILLSDDQGYGDLGITGNPVIETPDIDAFVKRIID